jgi:hypothetical protein
VNGILNAISQSLRKVRSTDVAIYMNGLNQPDEYTRHGYIMPASLSCLKLFDLAKSRRV